MHHFLPFNMIHDHRSTCTLVLCSLNGSTYISNYFYMHILNISCIFRFFCFFPVTASRCPIPRICPSSCGARAPVSACRPSRRFGICRGWAPGGTCWDGPWRACHGINCVGTVGGCLGGFLEKQYVQYIGIYIWYIYIYIILIYIYVIFYGVNGVNSFFFLNSGSGWIKTKPRTVL
jgi:hypothetical protein